MDTFLRWERLEGHIYFEDVWLDKKENTTCFLVRKPCKTNQMFGFNILTLCPFTFLLAVVLLKHIIRETV